MRSVRGFWRWLTSMRTALLLLLLLAVAAVPGSLLPQKGVSIERVRAYVTEHPTLGPWLNRFYFFEVYTSPWFAAIYLLLFVSLVGCLVPRLRQHFVNLFSRPPDAPARLDRLPRSATGLAAPGTPQVTAGALALGLRAQRWRTVVRDQADGSVTVAAEKGYVKETGNLVFHFALLALLVGVALGGWYGWHGNRLLVAGADSGFCDTPQQYDEFAPGAQTGGSDLPPFCLTLNSFQARYLDDGQPVQYTADMSYVESSTGPPQSWRLEVNDPLRMPGATVYLLGHGYAPILRYTDTYGHSQTAVVPFLPDDEMLTSIGVAKFPDANVDPTGRKPRDLTSQVAFAGVYLPTMPSTVDGTLSAFPAERNPGLVLTAYKGNLGLGVGTPQDVSQLDQAQIDSGQLHEVARSKALKPGESLALPDGTHVTFLGTRQWITISVRYDPGQRIVLGGAAALLVGLMVSLGGKRRRVWARVVPAADGRSLITLGGLARAETPGFADEFARVVELAGGESAGSTGESARSADESADVPEDEPQRSTVASARRDV
jgi:cytochrome c biogenesis protein